MSDLPQVNPHNQIQVNTMSVFSQESDSVLDSNNNNEPRTFQQWQQLRRSNPSGMAGYYSTKSQQQLMKDREVLGDRFYD